jgi:hypothetical protein
MLCSLTTNPSRNMWHGLAPLLQNCCGKDRGRKLTFNECYKAAHVPLFPPHRYPGVSGTYVDIVKDVVDIAAVHASADKFVS